jgi:hypothetical protein
MVPWPSLPAHHCLWYISYGNSGQPHSIVSGGFILSSNFQVEGKVKDLDISWSRAVDVVKAEKLIEQSNKPGGVDPLLVIICKWPQLPEYKANPKRIPSLEFLVRNID